MCIWDRKEMKIEWETKIRMKKLPNFVIHFKSYIFLLWSVSSLSLFYPLSSQWIKNTDMLDKKCMWTCPDKLSHSEWYVKFLGRI